MKFRSNSSDSPNSSLHLKAKLELPMKIHLLAHFELSALCSHNADFNTDAGHHTISLGNKVSLLKSYSRGSSGALQDTTFNSALT